MNEDLDDFRDIIILTFDDRLKNCEIKRFDDLYNILGFNGIMKLATKWKYPRIKDLYNIMIIYSENKIIEIINEDSYFV